MISLSNPSRIFPAWRARALLFSIFLLTLSVLSVDGLAQEPEFVRMETEAGDILITFYPELAPHHTAHFIYLSGTEFFDGTSFHRIVPGFVIQGGDPNSKDANPGNDGQGGPRMQDVLTPEEYAQFLAVNDLLRQKGYVAFDDRVNVVAEFSTTAKHERGVLSMARARDNDSAGSQFFICVAPRSDLDGKYTIFGSVVAGMDVVDAIISAPTKSGTQNPIQPVKIIKTTVLEGTADLSEAEQEAWQTWQQNL